MKKIKYDLFISLGEDCACTSYLRKNNLQFVSLPFDWLTCAPFETRIDSIMNNFENFLNIDDLYLMDIQNTPGNNFAPYANKRNSFIYYHDFDINQTLEQSYPFVKNKYDRRIKRLYKLIDKSKNILFIWFSRDKVLSDDTLKNALSRLNNKFLNKNINIAVLENNFNHNSSDIEKKHINDNIIKYIYNIESDDKSTPLAACMGNTELSTLIFRKYHIKNLWFYKLQKIIYHYLIDLIPFKKLRKAIRTYLAN